MKQSLVQFRKELGMLENEHKKALLCQDDTTANMQSIKDYAINALAMNKKISKLEKDLDSSTKTVTKQKAQKVILNKRLVTAKNQQQKSDVKAAEYDHVVEEQPLTRNDYNNLRKVEAKASAKQITETVNAEKMETEIARLLVKCDKTTEFMKRADFYFGTNMSTYGRKDDDNAMKRLFKERVVK